MEEKPRKYRGPETWAKVRELYLAGETGPVLAKRFDVGLANLRKKAHEEGWTKRRFALSADETGRRRMRAVPVGGAAAGGAVASTPSACWDEVEDDAAEAPTPEAAIEAGLAAAARQLASGRAGEASATLRAVEALARLTRPRAETGGGHPTVFTPAEERLSEEELDRLAVEIAVAEWAKVEARVAEVLKDGGPHLPSGISGYAYRWRARALGPEVAAADFEYARAHGFGERHWTEDGRLKPMPGDAAYVPVDLSRLEDGARER